LTDWYDPRQIREVLLKIGYNEIIRDDYGIWYFIKDQQRLAKLRIKLSPRGHEIIDRLQVELMCEYNGIPFEQFDSLYKKAKKHKL
jgi:hypothetical protein